MFVGPPQVLAWPHRLGGTERAASGSTLHQGGASRWEAAHLDGQSKLDLARRAVATRCA